jgi:hypothetical protein
MIRTNTHIYVQVKVAVETIAVVVVQGAEEDETVVVDVGNIEVVEVVIRAAITNEEGGAIKAEQEAVAVEAVVVVPIYPISKR